jgi:DNA-directed RNA polymerase subunit RPC12/RpoP
MGVCSSVDLPPLPPDDSDSSKAFVDGEMMYKCSFCGSFTGTYNAVSEHEQQCYKMGEMLYKCSFCGNFTGTYDSVADHEKMCASNQADIAAVTANWPSTTITQTAKTTTRSKGHIDNKFTRKMFLSVGPCL